MTVAPGIQRATRILAFGLLSASFFGCASTTLPPGEKLDPKTGVTLTFSSTPMVLYRDNPSQAAFARNLVSLGPLQVNRGGRFEYFLWLGIWNTNQTASVADRRNGFDSIVLFINGEPLPLELNGWTPDAIGASEPVYPQPVASALDAYYQVTLEQIQLLTDSDSLKLRTTGSAPREFVSWYSQETFEGDLAEFLRAVMQ